MELIYVRGGDKSAPEIAQKGGWHYGIRHDYKPYADVYMLDVKWDDYVWSDVLAKAARWQPKRMMVPDLLSPGQVPLMLSQIDDLKSLGVDRVMACPKFFGAVAHIPDDCIVAVSVPTGYAGYLPRPEELTGRDVHFLGGHPDQWAWLLRLYSSANVVSMDGNELGTKAAKGQYWDLSGRWVVPGRPTPTLDLAILSALNIRAYLESAPTVFRARRVTKCGYSSALI